LHILLVKNQGMETYVNFSMHVHSYKHTAAGLHSWTRGTKLGKTLEISKTTYNLSTEKEGRKDGKLLLQLLLSYHNL